MGYDDDIWEAVPHHACEPAAHLVEFVESLPRAEHALDLGCGDGRLAGHIETAALTGADTSAVALERAAARLPGADLVRVEPDAPLPFGDCSFDLVLGVEMVEHVRDLQLLLSEARRVLRPGGLLALTTPAHGRLTGLRALVRGFEREFPPLSPHIRFLTRRSLTGLLDDMGFEVEHLTRRRGTLLLRARR
ncbi:MAG TPA: methyltransferase domain-containing protein [Thermoleophilaceae bacterium]|nr:methyltransferase domain-containing protein [Thermoleophilaceae bacterium]